MIGPQDSFVWGSGGAQLTPSQIDAQRKVAQALMAQGTDYSPVQSWTQGAARVAQAIFGGMQARDANNATKANAAMEADLLAKYLPGGGATGVATTATPSVSTPMGQTSIPAGKDEFVSSVMPMAEQASLKTGVDPRLIVAQAAVESGYGQHAPGNNLFGIKSHGQPGGNTLATTEVVNGQPVRTTDSFRSYASPADSVMGYADFINSNPRYASLKSATGLDAQLSALGKSGYATDPGYAAKVGSIARSLPVPASQIVDANGPSPLDSAAYPVGPVGAPGTQVAQDDPAALPANAQPTQGYAIPGQAQAPAAPIINPAVLAKAAPYLSPFTQKLLGGVAAQQMEAARKQADPAYQLDLQLKRGQLDEQQRKLSKSDFEWKPIGKDANGEWSYGFVNQKTGEVRDRFNQPIPQQAQPVADPNAGLNGEDYLKAIPQDRADLARKVANGELDVASLPNRGNYRMQVLQDAARFDPTFNPADYKTRLATRKDFTSGNSARNITSFNTAIGHLDSLDKSIDALGNRSSPLYNQVSGAITGQYDSHYQAALKDFRTSKQAVADELARAFKGAGGTVHDISEWEKTINEADSPVALHAATKRAVELLKSRIDAVGDQYNRGMGKTTDPVSLLSPKARSTLERLEGGQTGKGGPVTINGYKIEAID